MNQRVTLFLVKAFLVSLPVTVLLCVYVISDPFKVLYAYPSYYTSGVPGYIPCNRDFVSTETFRRYYPTNQYDSFIIGNSRSLFYEVRDWQLHIQSTRCFHFDASAESLYGIGAKFRYLDRLGVGITNALVLLDYSTLVVTTNSPGHLIRKHPALSGEPPWIFQLVYLKAFLNGKFLAAYLHFKLTGQVHAYMVKDDLIDNRAWDYELDSNEIKAGNSEAMIATNASSYYAARREVLYPRSAVESCSPPAVGAPQKALLLEIHGILEKQKSNYRIVINPLYDQKKINPDDLNYLQNLFGRDRVFDFSGINKFTQCYTNYYESSHYRPQVAREIMNLIYVRETSHLSAAN